MVTGLRPKTGIGMGVTAGVSAGVIWGLAFPIPVLLHGWNAVTVTAGRYIAYGLASAVFFAIGGPPLRRLAAGHWWTALVFAVTGNVGYYLLLVIGIVTVGAPATDLVIGCIPIVLALVGNWVAPAYAWRRIVLPVVLVSVGLVIVNTLEISGSRAYNPAPVAVKIAGLIAAFGAVAIWSWYALANARFLADHADVSPAGWSTVVGVATGAVTIVAIPLAWATGQLAPSNGDGDLIRLIIGAAILGVGSPGQGPGSGTPPPVVSHRRWPDCSSMSRPSPASPMSTPLAGNGHQPVNSLVSDWSLLGCSQHLTGKPP